MSFSYEDFQKKANEDYKGLEVVGQDGKILFTLRSSIRLSDSDQARLKAAHTALTEYQTAEDAEPKASELKALIVNLLAVVADKAQPLREFVKPADLAVCMAMFSAYNAETQASEGN
jgi:hypothetical protein